MISPPRTLEDAVNKLMDSLSITQQSTIMSTPRDDMGDMLFFLGSWMKDNFGIWDKSNVSLFEACKTDNTDTVCLVILDELWKKLNE